MYHTATQTLTRVLSLQRLSRELGRESKQFAKDLQQRVDSFEKDLTLLKTKNEQQKQEIYSVSLRYLLRRHISHLRHPIT